MGCSQAVRARVRGPESLKQAPSKKSHSHLSGPVGQGPAGWGGPNHPCLLLREGDSFSSCWDFQVPMQGAWEEEGRGGQPGERSPCFRSCPSREHSSETASPSATSLFPKQSIDTITTRVLKPPLKGGFHADTSV